MISLHELEKLMPASLLEKLAVQYSVDAVNQVKLKGKTVFLCVLNGIINHPLLTQRILEEQYARQTGETCDHSAFGKRFANINPEYFRAILSHLSTNVAATKHDIRALRLRIVDSTVVTLSAKLLNIGLTSDCGKAGTHGFAKSVIELSDDGVPNLLHVCNERSEFCDSVAMGDQMVKAAQKRDLWIFDRGCNSRKVLVTLHGKGAFFITPHHEQGLAVTETVFTVGSEDPPLDAPGSGESNCRIHRIDRAYFDSARPVPGSKSMPLVVLYCHRYDSRAGKWKPFTLMTNLPLSKCHTMAGPYTFDEVLELYRRRWEIETFFRFIKQHLNFEHLTSRTENGITVMILMSLIAALLLTWYKNKTGIDRGWRSVKYWFAEDVRDWTLQSVQDMAICRRE